METATEGWDVGTVAVMAGMAMAAITAAMVVILGIGNGKK